MPAALLSLRHRDALAAAKAAEEELYYGGGHFGRGVTYVSTLRDAGEVARGMAATIERGRRS